VWIRTANNILVIASTCSPDTTISTIARLLSDCEDYSQKLSIYSYSENCALTDYTTSTIQYNAGLANMIYFSVDPFSIKCCETVQNKKEKL
jgi:hypothetical protein